MQTAPINSIAKILTLNNIAGWKKQELTDLANELTNEVAENGDDTLGLLALAAKLEHFAGEVKKAAKDLAIPDLAKYGKTGTSKSGVKLQLKEVGTRYDYENDSVWRERRSDAEEKLDYMAEWEKMLKSIPSTGLLVTDPDTGEIYRAYPPLKTAKESIQATIL